jgi:hypothetical protein
MASKMNHFFQCVACGEVCTVISLELYAGWYTCPACKELGLIVPETDLTPADPGFPTIVDFEIAEPK